MNEFRKKISDVLNVWTGTSIWCRIYDIVMILTIIMGLIPLAFHEKYHVFHYTDIVVVSIFIVDYLLRWLTADFRIKKGKWSFLIYPLTLFAIIDVICILPLFTDFGLGARFAMLLRLVYTLRFIKFIRYSKSVRILMNVFRKYGYFLMSIFFILIIYLLFSALVLFNVEPETFPRFFDAFYCSVMTMVTVGYGDIIAAAFVKELADYREAKAKEKEYLANIKEIEKRIEELEVIETRNKNSEEDTSNSESK